jgi:transcriptional regulator PpsR
LTDPLNSTRDLTALSALAPELASTMARVASDIALVIDQDGVIRNVAEGSTPLAPSCAEWVGQRWVDTVTGETRVKIERLLAEVQTSGVARRREVNHPGRPGSDDIPVAWAAVRLGDSGPVVAVGRDLRAVAAIQQRFVAAQQELERDYWRRRQAESRYRLLFQAASDAVLVLDAGTLSVLDANDAALNLLGLAVGKLVGRPLPDCVPAAARPAVMELLASARATGRAGEIRLRALGGGGVADVLATPFRAADGQQLLVRARRDASADAGAPPAVAEFVEQTPDAVVITDSSGRIQFANRAFVTFAGQAHETQLKGRPLPELLGDAKGLWRALLVRTRVQGVVSRTSLEVRLAGAPPLAVDATSTLMAEGEQECIGFTLRPAANPISVPLPPADDLLQGLAELSSQLGRTPLPDLLAEFNRVAEKHLIESAVMRAGGRTHVAAEMLGVTPESLQLRLRRHGLSAYVYSGPEEPSQSIN